MLQGRTEMEQRGKEGRGSAGKQSCRLSGSMIRLDQPSFPSSNPRIQYSAPTPAPPPHAHILCRQTQQRPTHALNRATR
jgi:hypothetical protein